MWKRLLLVLGVVILTGCASAPDATSNDIESSATVVEEKGHPNDPFEEFNRAMWTVNYEYLDPYLFRPVSLGYVNHVPSFLRTGIRNFIENLEEPFKVLNNLITLDGKAALHHFNRFWINSSFGLVGILDIASKAGILPSNDKQFGDVMGYYGVEQGPFFMIPGYGPLTLREGVGDVVDNLYPPLSLLNFPQTLLRGLFLGMETRAALVAQESLLENSPDPYAFTRDAYLQNKAFKARGNKGVPIEEPDDEFLDEALLEEIDNY